MRTDIPKTTINASHPRTISRKSFTRGAPFDDELVVAGAVPFDEPALLLLVGEAVPGADVDVDMAGGPVEDRLVNTGPPPAVEKPVPNADVEDWPAVPEPTTPVKPEAVWVGILIPPPLHTDAYSERKQQ
ncbi:hypothetical protein V5O48_005793 [Marasmius crinis-equi]|uniref:Uncharacterized protein n=1 Tax=Marasmius crinis-equi TaxID=585013 RepID=A0ABR3FLD8_9AGAR